MMAIQTVEASCSGTVEPGSTKELAVAAFLHLYLLIGCASGAASSMAVTVTSALPIGAGLGSSAAFGVCLASSMLYGTAKVELDASGALPPTALDLVNKWAFVSEQVIHGTPSGIDNSISTSGGALTFIKGEPPNQLASMPNLRVLLVNTRVSRSTKEYVAGVRRKRDTFPTPMNQILDAMDSISKDVCGLLADLKQAQDSAAADQVAATSTKIEELVELNQHLLNAIGVGHPALDTVCAATKKFGLAAKLTGAGGGGCAFVLIPSTTVEATMDAVRKELGEDGFDVFETTVGSAGKNPRTCSFSFIPSSCFQLPNLATFALVLLSTTSLTTLATTYLFACACVWEIRYPGVAVVPVP
jgi:mevalonate kinase